MKKKTFYENCQAILKDEMNLKLNEVYDFNFWSVPVFINLPLINQVYPRGWGQSKHIGYIWWIGDQFSDVTLSSCTIGLRYIIKDNFNTVYNCEYIEVFDIKSAETSTKSMPCSNRPIKCQSCYVIVKSYNHSKHFKSDHPNDVVPRGRSDERKTLLWKNSKNILHFILFCAKLFICLLV